MEIKIKSWDRFEVKSNDQRYDNPLKWFASPVKCESVGKDRLHDMGIEGYAIFHIFDLLIQEVANQKKSKRGSLVVTSLASLARRMGVEKEFLEHAIGVLKEVGWVTVTGLVPDPLQIRYGSVTDPLQIRYGSATLQDSTLQDRTRHNITPEVSVPNGTSWRSCRTPHFDSPASKPECDIVVESDKKAIPEPSCATSGHVPYEGDDAKCIQVESEPPSPSPDSQVDADRQVDADDAEQQPDAKSLSRPI